MTLLRPTSALTVALLLCAGPVAAQQAPAPQPAPSNVPVLVTASAELPETVADTAEAPAPQAQAPAKPRRAARVTTCRCGDESGK